MKNFSIIFLIIITTLCIPIMALGEGLKDAPPPDSWVYESYQLVYNAGLIKGYPDGTFRGERAATRNEVVTFLARLLRHFDEKIANLEGDNDFLKAEDVKRIIAEELSSQNATLSKEQLEEMSAELLAHIQKLEKEFKVELQALNIRVTTLETQVEKLQNDVEEAKQSADEASKEAKKAKTAATWGIILGALGIIVALL